MGFLDSDDREVLERIGFQNGRKGGSLVHYLNKRLSGGDGLGGLAFAGNDRELALWMARGCCALGDYEHYYMAAQWLGRAGGEDPAEGEFLYLMALAAMYCGRPEEALSYAESSVGQEERRPEAWHLLAELYSFAGEQQKALGAVEKGRLAGGFPEDWDQLEQAVLAGEGLEAMEKTRIRNVSARAGEQGSLLEKCRLEAADGLVCNQAGLEEVMKVLKPEVWDGDEPYCGFCCQNGDRELTGAFYMNEAAVSKWKPEELRRILGALPEMEGEGRKALAENGAGDGELCLLELYPDHTLGLVFETETGEQKVAVDGAGTVSREMETTASAESSLLLREPGWNFEQLKKDLYLDWGISCGEMEEKGMLTFLDGGMKVTVSLGLDGNRNVCLTAVVLGEEGQQLEAELELERVLESCRKQKGVV